MTVDHVEVLVEELSMEAALEWLLPKMLPNTSFRVHTHQGKLDLLGKLPEKLKAYSRWIPATWRIVVVVDRDDDDCEDLKKKLEDAASRAGFATRSTAKEKARYVVVNRLAIEELESWYFGDWKAVCTAYPKAPPTVPAKAGTVLPTRSRAVPGKPSCAFFNR